MVGIGTDIVEIKRIEELVYKHGSQRLLTFSENEVANTLVGHRKIEWIAGRFAAKEAIIKAVHKKRACVLSDIEVLPDETGAPVSHMAGFRIEISIAHEKNYATAFAIAFEDTL